MREWPREADLVGPDGDDAGLLKKVTGFDNTKVEYDYDERRIEKVYVTSSDETKKQVLEYTYNDGANGDIPYDAITTITDVNGKETTFEYDVLGRVTSVTIPADGQGGSAQTWQYAYAANGDHYNALEVTVTRPDSETVVYQYNPDGTLAWVDAPDVGGDMKTEFGYDNQGRLLQLTDPDDNVTLWSYDAAGRVMEEKIAQTPEGPYNTTSYGYNPDGQIAYIGDPLGQTFGYDYDDNNWLSSITMTDTEQTETVKAILYSWNTDAKTMLWTVSVGSDSVKIKYNEYGLLDYVDGVLGGDDANADLVRYGYDDDYRLTELGYYIYDDGDYVLWTTSYDYDTFGRLETIEDRLGLASTYAYNDDHTLESLTLPNGTVTDYTYDDLRRLVSIATTGLSASDVIVKFTYEYNDLGLRDKVTMHDGRTTEWSYDDVGRLVQEHFKSGGPSPETLLRYVYTYDAAGNRTSKKTDYDDDDGSFAATATYTNNGYNQLTAVSGTPGRGTKVNVTGTIPTAWTLTDADVVVTPNEGDPVPAEVRGRFFTARNVPLQDGDNTLVASTTATTLAGNEPTSDTVEDVTLDTSLDEQYTYNANGDLILKSEEGGSVLWTYSYSVDGWLVKVEGPGDLVEQYFYDPAGRKYKVTTTQNQQTSTRYFVYDGGSIVLELDSSMELAKEYIRGLSLGGGIGGLLYVRDADDSAGYFHYDGQGNVVSVTDDSRTEVAYYEYDAWGNLLILCGTLANEFKFSTKQTSTSAGLIDFGYRSYDAKVGRWTQRDRIGVADGPNRYGCLGNNPVSTIDPWGLLSKKRHRILQGYIDSYLTPKVAAGQLTKAEAFCKLASRLAHLVAEEKGTRPDEPLPFSALPDFVRTLYSYAVDPAFSRQTLLCWGAKRRDAQITVYGYTPPNWLSDHADGAPESGFVSKEGPAGDTTGRKDHFLTNLVIVVCYDFLGTWYAKGAEKEESSETDLYFNRQGRELAGELGSGSLNANDIGDWLTEHLVDESSD